MNLNQKQKKIVLDFIGERDIYRLFDCLDKSYVYSGSTKLRIKEADCGWWSLEQDLNYKTGLRGTDWQQVTTLNFKTYHEVLEKVMAAK